MGGAVRGRVRILGADGVFLGRGPVVLRGLVAVDEQGTILEAGEANVVRAAFPGAPEEWASGVLMPGLVNAHTHLELSALRGRTHGGRGFVPWVDGMLAARGELDDAEAAEGVERGVNELAAAGTVAVGDVSGTLAAVGALRRAGIMGCIFHEVFGLDEARTCARVDALAGEAASLGLLDDSRLAWGPSPHTLHTTHPAAVRALLRIARARGARFSVHLAEHAAERAALEVGTGPMVDWLEARTGTPRERFRWHAADPFSVAAELGALATDAVLVHLTDARDAELEAVARAGSHVVLCPRSNLFIEARLPPVRAMRRIGLEPALGTDSLASSPSLDVLAEARALRERFPEVPAHELLQMATSHGARALGLESLGSFACGKRPGVLLVEGAVPTGLDPAAFVLGQSVAGRRMLFPPGENAR